MKVYNPKDWISLIFNSTNTQMLKQMNQLLLAICATTAIIVYIEQDYLKLSDSHPLRNTVALQSLLGFAISILLVFRTNTAYDRWWEGRKLWGTLVNSSRNLAIKLKTMIHPEDRESIDFFSRYIPLYARVLHLHLLKEETRLLLDEINHPELNETDHLPNQVALLIHTKIRDLYKAGKINDTDLLLIKDDLNTFTDVCGACERIKNTPIPYSYSSFIKKFIFFYVVSMPIGLSFTLGYYSIPIVAFVFYVMVGMELVAEEIEDPFGGDLNDIPMDKIAKNIELHVKEIL